MYTYVQCLMIFLFPNHAAKAQAPGPEFCPGIPPLACEPGALMCAEGYHCSSGQCCIAYNCPHGVGVCKP